MMRLHLLVIIFCQYVVSAEKIPSFVNLLNEDYNFPVLGFGTAAMGGKTIQSFVTAYNAGIRMVDAAQATEWYDEADVGKAIKHIHSYDKDTKIVTVTKVHPRSFEYSKMENKIKESQINLADQKSSLDVVLLHSSHCWPGHCTPAEEKISWHTGWRNLEALKRQGLVDHIGVSNFDSHLLQELLSMSDSKVAVVQNWMDPFWQDKQTRALAAKHGVVYMAYSSLGTQWEHKLGYNPVFENKVLQDIAQKHRLSVAQVVISWVLQSHAVAIPRSTNEEHINDLNVFMTDSSDTLQVFLDDDDMKQIDSLDGTLGAPWD